jgi:hypothetical protein
MRCFDVQAELETYIDGELSPERTALLEGHLVDCEGCRAELARLQAVVAALETWPLVAEPAQLTARVMARLRPRPVVSAADPELVLSPSTTLRTSRAEGHGRRVEPPALPAFRIHWSDLAISLAGASLVFVAALLWRYLAATDLASLYRIDAVSGQDRHCNLGAGAGRGRPGDGCAPGGVGPGRGQARGPFRVRGVVTARPLRDPLANGE